MQEIIWDTKGAIIYQYPEGACQLVGRLATLVHVFILQAIDRQGSTPSHNIYTYWLLKRYLYLWMQEQTFDKCVNIHLSLPTGTVEIAVWSVSLEILFWMIKGDNLQSIHWPKPCCRRTGPRPARLRKIPCLLRYHHCRASCTCRIPSQRQPQLRLCGPTLGARRLQRWASCWFHQERPWKQIGNLEIPPDDLIEPKILVRE